MFKKTKSKVLVDYASEEDDMSWHHHHSYKDKDIEGEEENEEAVTAVSKEAKVKKIMSKKERREKKMFSSKDDEHFLLTGVKLTDRRGSHKKIKDEEKEKKDKPEKGLCFWESVTMTMRQISPAKKLEKMEGWEPPHLENLTETVTDEPLVERSQKVDLAVSLPDSLSVPLELASWGGRGLEEDSSRYANLSDSNDPAAAVRWTARAKVRLAGISRMSRGIVSESSAWEGFK
ncbi:testis development-related protein [Salarias fasciatus]|uniref:testis development-related protein n=1 Tax=Salarias fasciatus TaxID=181472 RepID=UPI001176E9FE|nr:testis development-related protein-like [Salarias fasciatus]XP_029966483.1 testis development-related protein-like [Salarias fasciatus]XP_029966484.1 testis development-related protein-like [Salarias fasciatus]